MTDFDISNFPTYATGKLKDLHQFRFQLNSVNTEHKFKNFKKADAFLVDHPGEPVPLNIVADWIDNTFDMILIKVTGRSDNANPTRLLYNTISTQEIVYDETSALGRLMTPCNYLPNFGNTLVQSNNDGPAAKI